MVQRIFPPTASHEIDKVDGLHEHVCLSDFPAKCSGGTCMEASIDHLDYIFRRTFGNFKMSAALPVLRVELSMAVSIRK